MEIKHLVTNKGLKLDGPFLIKPKIFKDERGIFYESWNLRNLEKLLNKKIPLCQENISQSNKGVIRGLHYQINPFTQAKIVSCNIGEIFDVVVDIRRGSKTFGQWSGAILNNKNNNQLYIPEGFAHGFLSLKNLSVVTYLVNNYWSKDHERAILWSDKQLNIKWPLENLKENKLIISNKDKKAISFKEFLKSKEVI